MIKDYSRLAEIVSLAEESEVTVDVGCDHGFVTEYLLRNNIAKKVIATDISEKCLNKTKQLLQKMNLSTRAEFVVTDGLIGINSSDIDQIIIAGMGGSTIIKILNEMPLNCQKARLILQPMNDIRELRVVLNKLGFKIQRDKVIADGKKFYHIMTAINDVQKLTDIQIDCGVNTEDYRSDDYQAWLDFTIKKLKNISKNMPNDNPRKKKFLKGIAELSSLKMKGE